jgi:hypothetical protein
MEQNGYDGGAPRSIQHTLTLEETHDRKALLWRWVASLPVGQRPSNLPADRYEAWREGVRALLVEAVGWHEASLDMSAGSYIAAQRVVIETNSVERLSALYTVISAGADWSRRENKHERR